jgi:hypothetical protein
MLALSSEERDKGMAAASLGDEYSKEESLWSLR